jgi:3-oxoacid CoA-transferase subunit B
VVDRIISDLAIFDVEGGGLVLRKLAPGVSVEEVREKTGADFKIELSEEKI